MKIPSILIPLRPTPGGGALLLSAATLAAAEGSPAPTNAPAPAPLPLEALVAEVVQNNPELEFYRAEIAAAKAGRKSAGQWENPALGADLGNKHVWDRGGGTLGDGVAWSVSVAQKFEYPGRIALRKAIVNRQTELAQLGLDQFQAGLAARARALGYAVFIAQEKAAAAREVSQRFQALLEVVVQREPAGVTPLLDQRILEASTMTLHRRASQAAQQTQAALLELNQLRGQPPAAELSVSGNVSFSTNVPALAALTTAAGTNNFEVRQRQVELAQQGFRVQLSKNERYPSVTVAPFYASEQSNDEQRIVGVGVSVPVPLWNRNTAGLEASRARLQQAEASVRTTWRQVERSVVEHTLALQTKLDEMARWRSDAQAQFREAAALADRHYRLGAVPVTIYVEMQMRYLDALEALLATRSEALEHRQQLELLIGMPLDKLAAP